MECAILSSSWLPHQSFILPSYVEALTLTLVNLCSIPLFPEPRTKYHPSVEIIIDDEVKEASVYNVFGLFFPLIIFHLYLIETQLFHFIFLFRVITLWVPLREFFRISFILGILCCDVSFGLVTKARVYKGVHQEWNPRVTFHVFESVRECEEMNPHILKWVPTLGVGVPMDSQIFKEWFQRFKFIGLKFFLYH
jgi:hypothetical protein